MTNPTTPAEKFPIRYKRMVYANGSVDFSPSKDVAEIVSYVEPTEYLSLEEHDALLREAVANAYEKAIDVIHKNKDNPYGIIALENKFREKAKKAREGL